MGDVPMRTCACMRLSFSVSILEALYNLKFTPASSLYRSQARRPCFSRKMSGRGNIWLAGQGAVMDMWEACGAYVGAGGSMERAREESEGIELFCPRLKGGK